MKKNEFIIIKGLDVKELKAKVVLFKKEIDDLTMDKNMRKLKDLKKIFKKKKELAQVLTVLGQKNLLAKLEPKVTKIAESSVVSLQTKKQIDEKLKKANKKKGEV